MVSAMPTPGLIEASFLVGIGASDFVTLTSLVSSYLSGYFACQTAGSAIGSSVARGLLEVLLH
tara:strand:- start:1602 stop:1790 length:189 start_codon:yes stop_codon:yes gene_type:complete